MAVDIDSFVDYKTEYSKFLSEVKVQENNLTALCPFHNDAHAGNFGVDLKTGKFNCFACGESGNYITFRAKLARSNKKDAMRAICQEHGIEFQENEKKRVRAADNAVPLSYNLKEYAFEKQLPEDWLVEHCGLRSEKDSHGSGYVHIPYWNINKEIPVNVEESTGRKYPVYRKRFNRDHNPRMNWSWNSRGHTIIYGEWKVKEYYEKGYTILVEGESDTHTLWYLGFNALGVPGASNFQSRWMKYIVNIPKLYIHIEPDDGGEVFRRTLIKVLADCEYAGEVFLWSCSDYAVKDPSDLYIKNRDKTPEILRTALSKARKINIYEEEAPVSIEDAPIHLMSPERWHYSDTGIKYEDPKNGTTLICKTPIILSKRLYSLDTGDEKVEVSFKRDGKWKSVILPRTTVFQSKSIVTLASMGCTITSENARKIVQFLGALEAENMDRLEKVKSTATCGWKSTSEFVPYCADSVVIDSENSMRDKLGALGASGSLDDWVAGMATARKNPFFRFILAAGFAPPLLKVVGCRNFTVYNWGDSKNGKTAALFAALSAWGNPQQLAQSFNTTQVAVERLAGFFSDMPVGLDELQSANSRNRQEFIEKMIYMLGNGIGKARGSIEGMQETLRWRTIALGTGEEPIINKNTMDGVATRLIEFTGAPFKNSSEAANMYSVVSDNYGVAGPDWIDYIIKHRNGIVDVYENIKQNLKIWLDKKKIDIDNNKLAMLGLIFATDTLITKVFFDKGKNINDCRRESLSAGLNIIRNMTSQDVTSNTNVYAVEYINEWLGRKASCFANSPTDVLEWYGIIDEMDRKAYVLGTILHDTLEKAGFSHRKTMKYLADKQIIQIDSKGKYQIVKKVGGRPIRMVAINLDKLIEDEANSSVDDAGELGGQEITNDDNPFL